MAILIQCREKGVTQERENIIYKNNGGYTYDDFVFFDGAYIAIESSNDRCIGWDFPSPCQSIIYRCNGDEITLELEKTFETKSLDALEGYLYEVEATEVFCKRKAL